MSNKVKIPKNLANFCMHSKTIRKAVDSLLMLKHLLPHGYMCADTKGLQALENDLGISYKTIQRRLFTLKNLGLVTYKGGKMVHFASWVTMRQITECSATSFYNYNIDLLKIVSIEHQLEALAINEYQEQCKKAYYTKINKDDLKSVIIERAFDGVKPFESFTEAVTIAHLADYIQGRNKESYYLYEYNRSDAQIGYKRLTQLFGYNSWGGMAYKKRKLQVMGLIDVQKRQIEFDRSLHTNTQARKTVLGSITYQKATGKLQLTLPDSIKIQSQKQILTHLQKLAA